MLHMIKQRLFQARKNKGYSREALAEKAGVSTSTITFLENGRNESSKFLVEIASALDVTAEWLKGEDGLTVMANSDAQFASACAEYPGFKKSYDESFSYLSKIQKGMNVPVISWVSAGNWTDIKSYPEDDSTRWLPCPTNHGDNTFALIVSGLSMNNPNGVPSFDEGDIIFVDPDKQYENKSLVIAVIDNESTATFKQLIIEGDQKYLRPLNPAWPEQFIKINGNARICGVVIGKWVDM